MKTGAVIGAAVVSLSLSLFNAIFVLGPLAGLLAALVGLWAAAAALAAAGAACALGPLAWLVAPPLRPYLQLETLNPAFVALAGIGLAALGLLGLIGMGRLTRLVFRALGAYVRFTLRLVRRSSQPDPSQGEPGWSREHAGAS